MLRAQNSVPHTHTHTPARAHTHTHAHTHPPTNHMCVTRHPGDSDCQPLEVICTVRREELARQGGGKSWAAAARSLPLTPVGGWVNE